LCFLRFWRWYWQHILWSLLLGWQDCCSCITHITLLCTLIIKSLFTFNWFPEFLDVLLLQSPKIMWLWNIRLLTYINWVSALPFVEVITF
jgi:hypothetical protein